MAMKYSEFDTYPLQTKRYTTYDSRGGVNVVKATAGFLHAVTFAQVDAAPTAGVITIYNVYSSGTTSVYGDSTQILFSHSQTTAVFMPQTVILDVPFDAGLAIGFPVGMTDVGVTLSYK